MSDHTIDWEKTLKEFSTISIKNNDHEGVVGTNNEKEVNKTISNLSNIIAHYRVSGGPIDKWETVGKLKVEEILKFYITKNQPIRMVLPAFPFKSPNIQDKVISKLPDLATELALTHLNGLAASMSDMYRYGVYILIIPDGIVYNDILGVNDEDVWNYAKEVQNLIKSLYLFHLRFVPLHRIFSNFLPTPTCKEYCLLVKEWRNQLFTQWLPENYSVEKEIKTDQDALATYRGYCKFLALDMAKTIKDLSSSKRRTICSSTAKEMIRRGKCFSKLVATIPNHIRLSIHPCENSSKISITLFPGKLFRERTVTPWHNTVILDSHNGMYRVSSSGLVGDSYEIVKKDNRPWYLCNFPIKLSMKSQVELLYPHGLKITCQEQEPLNSTDYQKIQQIVVNFGMVVMQGFNMNFEQDSLCSSLSSSARGSVSSSVSSTTGTETSENSSSPSLSSQSSGNNSIIDTIEGVGGLDKFPQLELNNTSVVGQEGIVVDRMMENTTVVLKGDEIHSDLVITSLRLANEHFEGSLDVERTTLFSDRRHAYFPSNNQNPDNSLLILYDSEQCVANIG